MRKKIFRIAIVALLTVSLSSTVFAGLTDSYTPDDVMTWLEEGDENAETVDQQVVNGLARVTEMLAYAAGINANEEQSDRLDVILETIKDSMASDESSDWQDMAVTAIGLFHTLGVVSEETDPEGKYQEAVDALSESFAEGDESAENTDGQVVNALNQSVMLAALITEECCSTQDMVDQIEGGLEEFAEESQAAEDITDQMAVGAKWLYRMLGAFARVQNPDNIDALTALTESVEQDVEEEPGPSQAMVHWLYGAVNAVKSLT